jgi:hypothetical protein
VCFCFNNTHFSLAVDVLSKWLLGAAPLDRAAICLLCAAQTPQELHRCWDQLALYIERGAGCDADGTAHQNLPGWFSQD